MSVNKESNLEIIAKQTEIMDKLAEVKTIEDAKDFNAWAKSFKAFVRSHHQKKEIRFIADEAWIRGQRLMGFMIQEKQDKGELEKAGGERGNQYTKESGIITESNNAKTLSDFGITPQESMVSQQFSSIPEETFEEEIANIKVEQEKSHAELTTARFLRLAKSLQKEDAPKKERDINDVANKMSDDLQAILNTFSQIAVHWEEVNNEQKEKLGIKLKRLLSIFQELQADQKSKKGKNPLQISSKE